MQQVSVVVLNYNDYITTYNFVMSISQYEIINHILVVDNCSTDDSFEHLKHICSDKIEVIKTDYNGGYGYGNNCGIKYLYNKYKSLYIAISNPDVEIAESAIVGCLDDFEHENQVAIVAPMMKMPNGNIDFRCVWKVPSFYEYLFFSLALFKKKRDIYYTEQELCHDRLVKVGCVAGSFLIINTPKFIDCGLYDEGLFLYCEETVAGLRLRDKGYISLIDTEHYFVHHHSVSINKSIKKQNIQKKMMWDSRCYVLQNYYDNSLLRKILISMVRKTALIECRIIEAFKSIR